LDLPQKSVGITIVVFVAGTPANDLTAASFKEIVAVPGPPFSKAIDSPAVVPPKLIAPDGLSAII